MDKKKLKTQLELNSKWAFSRLKQAENESAINEHEYKHEPKQKSKNEHEPKPK